MTLFESVKEFLSEEGFRFKIDDDGDIAIKYEGVNYYISEDPNDPEYFRLFMPNIYTVEDNRVKVLEAINEVCLNLKVLKAYLVGENLCMAVEMIVVKGANVGEFLPRCLSLLHAARQRIASLIFKE